MQNTSIDKQLALAEHQLDLALLSLNAGHSDALVQASEELRATAIGLVQLMHSVRSHTRAADYSAKIGELAQRLIFLRENLIRRAAYVDRALQVVMPAVEKATYQTRGVYGSSLRSAGALNVATA